MLHSCTIYLNTWKMFVARHIWTTFTVFNVAEILSNVMSANVHSLCLLLIFWCFWFCSHINILLVDVEYVIVHMLRCNYILESQKKKRSFVCSGDGVNMSGWVGSTFNVISFWRVVILWPNVGLLKKVIVANWDHSSHCVKVSICSHWFPDSRSEH